MFGKKESQSEKNSSGHTKITSHAWTVCEHCGKMMFVPDRISWKYRCQFCGTRGTNYRTGNLDAALSKSKEIKARDDFASQFGWYICSEREREMYNNEFMVEVGYVYTYDGFTKEEGTKQWENT